MCPISRDDTRNIGQLSGFNGPRHLPMKESAQFALSTAAVLLITGLAFGQSTSPTVPPSSTTSPRPYSRPAHRDPCWEKAGVPSSVMEQRRQIAETAHSQEQAVCTDSSLTPQQKQQQIREIRNQVRSQEEGLVSSEQLAAIRSCRAQRGEGGRRPGVANPCAMVGRAPAATPDNP